MCLKCLDTFITDPFVSVSQVLPCLLPDTNIFQILQFLKTWPFSQNIVDADLNSVLIFYNNYNHSLLLLEEFLKVQEYSAPNYLLTFLCLNKWLSTKFSFLVTKCLFF